MSFQMCSESSEFVELMTGTMIDTAREYGVEPKNIVRYNCIWDGNLWVSYRDNKLLTDEELNVMPMSEINKLTFYSFVLVPISQYNTVMNAELTVNKGEALLLKLPYDKDNDCYDLIPINGELHTENRYNNDGEFVETATWCDRAYLKCVGMVEDFVVRDGKELSAYENSGIGDNGYITHYAFINDEDFYEQYQKLCAMYGERETETTIENEDGSSENLTYIMRNPMMYHYFGMDVDCGDDTMAKIAETALERSIPYRTQSGEFYTLDGKTYRNWNAAVIYGVYEERSEYYGLYGGLFFLGVLFCAVFVAAAVMIMYYKQITEGYEDRMRYQILQKVGMTKAEIRSTINSQVLTMFLLPLLTAGLHTVFAFGIISKLLMLFGAMDVWFLALVAFGCFLVYAVVYVIVYTLTSKIYYKIVAA